MKKLTFISSLLFVAFLSPVMAEKKHRPFEYHGSAARIKPDGSLREKAKVQLVRDKLAREGRGKFRQGDPMWIVKPLEPAYSRMESPSAGDSAPAEGTSFAKCLGKILCPLHWFKK